MRNVSNATNDDRLKESFLVLDQFAREEEGEAVLNYEQLLLLLLLLYIVNAFYRNVCCVLVHGI